MEKKPVTNWQAVGIGALVGPIPILVLWVGGGSSDSYLSLFIFVLLIILGLPALFGGIIGATIGKKWKNSKTAIWSGAVLGTILGAAPSLSFLGIGYINFYR